MQSKSITIIILILLIGCNKEDTSVEIFVPETHPIQVENRNGQAVFIDERTDNIFTPRGTNYFNIVNSSFGLQDRFFHPLHFNAQVVRSHIQQLKGRGYNTIRVFLDTCSDGEGCIGNLNGQGLNIDYMRNVASLMQIAKEEDFFLILTSNDLPDQGGYWEISNQGANEFIDGYRNSHYLTSPGVESAMLYWEDLMQALTDLNAEFSHVLGWSILNEQWFFNNAPPFSLTSGSVVAANGKTYSLSSESDKLRMAEESTDYYISKVAATIRKYDEDGLITMGIFSPNQPHVWRPGDFKMSLASVTENSDLDFLDLHIYPGTSTMDKLMENFQISNTNAKPIIMGEVGAFVSTYNTVQQAEDALQNWIALSCDYNFDGWLTWGLLRAPLAIGDATWSLLDENARLLEELSPLKYPDPCNSDWRGAQNIALNKAVTVSSELSGEQGMYAVDGDLTTQWGSGDLPPQWIEIDLGITTSISRISLVVAQFPQGETQHMISTKGENGAFSPLIQFSQNTQEGDRLEWSGSRDDVRYLRVETSSSPSWVSWKEIEVY